MKLYDFIILSQEERAEVVFHDGIFLASNPERGNLYFVGNFYAEVIYDDDRNEIQEVNCFKTSKRLLPYLEYISIPEAII